MDSQMEKEFDSGGALHDEDTSPDCLLQDMKREAIIRACREGDQKQLVQLATSPNGLLDARLRQSAWPLLLGCQTFQPSPRQPNDKSQERAVHPDEDQVQRDVDRAFVYYPNNESSKTMESNKEALFELISQILRCHPRLSYSQGYHDIAQVVMLVMGKAAAFPVIESISLLRIRDYMLPSLTPALKHLQLVPGILHSADKELADHLTLPYPNYALPAAITLYAHEIQDYSAITRLFDFLLAHEPVISLYLFAAIMISRREKLLEIPADDQDMLFFTLQKLPQPLDLERLIQDALRLFDEIPPERLRGRAWQRISSSSVLKTSRSIDQPDSIEVAEKHLVRQIKQVWWEEKQEKAEKAVKAAFRRRRLLANAAATVAIGAIAVWLRRSGNDRIVVSFVLSLVGLVKER